MPDTCREQILAALTAQIAAAVTDAAVERERRSPVTDAELPRVLVFDGGPVEEMYLTGAQVWRLAVGVECLALAPADRAADGAARDAAAVKAADALAARVLNALQADPTLGGLAWELRPSAELLPKLADLSQVDAARSPAAVEVVFATKEADLFTFA